MNRRQFLHLCAGSAMTAALPRILPGQQKDSAKRPNIIVIMADDMGFSDLGCYGSEISTPNLDRLAAGGMRFTQFYNTGRCCPTRAALLTGLYSHQAGVGEMTADRGLPGYRGHLNDRCVTIAEALGQSGYHTLMSGKWHVGDKRPHWPVDRGFEKYFGLLEGASNYFHSDKKMAIDDQPYKPKGDDFYMTDAITDHAVDYINEYTRKADPFFLYVAYTAPHYPLHAWPKDITRYKGKYMAGWDALRRQRYEKMIQMGLIEPKWPLSPRDERSPAWDDVKNKEAEDLKMAVYAAQIDRMDQGIGKIMDKLQAAGELENTLILFLCDNGGCAEKRNSGSPDAPLGSEESYLSYGLPWAAVSNTPFRLYKQRVHEGGIASPLIACWPNTIRPGQITHQPGHVMDIMATCLDIANAKYPETFKGREITPLEGISLLPAFQGRAEEGHDALYWEHMGNRAVRQGKWKLVALDGERWELYDMEADRSELTDLSIDQPEKAAELVDLYNRWAERCGVLTQKELQNRPKMKK